MTIKSFIYDSLPKIGKKYFDHIERSPIGYRLAKGAFWSLAGAVISRGLMLVASIGVARMLGKTGFGEFGMIQSTVGMFGVFAGFGLGLTATKYVAEYRKSDPGRAGRIIALSELVAIGTGGLMAIGLFFFAPWLAEHTINAPHLAGVLQIGAIILFLSAITGAQSGVLAGFEAFKTNAYINLVIGLISFPMLVGGVYYGGLTGAVWALAVNLGLNWFLNHRALRNESLRYGISTTFSDCGREGSVLWKFSLPAVLGGALVGPVSWACNAMLVNQPNGYSEMGIYNAVTRIKQVPEMVLMMLMAPLLPMLSEYFGKKDMRTYNKILNYAFALSMLAVVPLSLIQASVPQLTLLPYGPNYQGNTSTVQWLMLQAVIVGLFQSFSIVISSMNRMWFGFVFNLSWGMIYLTLAYLWVPRYGAAGLAAAYASTYLITSIACAVYIFHYEKPFVAETPLAKWIITVLVMFSVCATVGRIASPVVAGAIGCALAVACMIMVFRAKRFDGIPRVGGGTTPVFPEV